MSFFASRFSDFIYSFGDSNKQGHKGGFLFFFLWQIFF